MWITVTTYAFVLLGLGFALSGVGVIWWALFYDKSRGRRRCPKCWYDLDHTTELTCSECGWHGTSERQTHRTRRKWWLAGSALAILLAVTAWTRLQATSSGWSALIPTPILVGLAPWMEPPGALEEGWRDLTQRVWRRQLSVGSALALASTLGGMINGDATRDPASELLVDLLNREPESLVPRDTDSDDERDLRELRRAEFRRDLDDELREIPFVVTAKIPPVWPAGVKPGITVQGTLWGVRTEWRARVQEASATPVDEHGAQGGAPIALAPNPDIWLTWRSTGWLRSSGPRVGVLPISPLPLGLVRVDATLALETRRWDWVKGDWGPWTAADPVQLSQTTRCAAGDPFKWRADPKLGAVIRATFANVATTWQNDNRPVGVRYNPDGFEGAENSDVLVGVLVELVQNGTVRRRNKFWWRGGTENQTRGTLGWLIEVEDLPALRTLRESTDGWTLRITGDADTALRALPRILLTDDTTKGTPPDGEELPAEWRIWIGTYEQPLDVVHSRAAASDLIWRVDPR